eukprot:3575091-Rhodomonas_salina.1
MATVSAHNMCWELTQAGAETLLQSSSSAMEAILPVPAKERLEPAKCGLNGVPVLPASDDMGMGHRRKGQKEGRGQGGEEDWVARQGTLTTRASSGGG